MQNKARIKGRNQRHVSGLSGPTKEAAATRRTRNTTTARSTTPSPTQRFGSFFSQLHLRPARLMVSSWRQKFPTGTAVHNSKGRVSSRPVHLCECQVPQRYVNTHLYNRGLTVRWGSSGQVCTEIDADRDKSFALLPFLLLPWRYEFIISNFSLSLSECLSCLFVFLVGRAKCEAGGGGLPVVVI